MVSEARSKIESVRIATRFAGTTTGQSFRLQLTNLHGDVVGTIDSALAEPEFFDYDEFGVPMAAQTDQRYGWLSGKQRSGEALGDVILGGVRLYSPGIGLFLTVDPVQGGSSTDYDYSYQDPVNVTDLDGRCPPCAAGAAIGGGIAARFLIRQAARHLAKKAARRNQHIRRVAGNPPARPQPGVTSNHRNSNAYRGRSWGYQINFTHSTRKGNHERVYKYGITSGVVGWIRAGQSLRQCVNSGRNDRRITKIIPFRDRYSARLWEFRSFMSYVRRYGVRPPGMDRSCR